MMFFPHEIEALLLILVVIHPLILDLSDQGQELRKSPVFGWDDPEVELLHRLGELIETEPPNDLDHLDDGGQQQTVGLDFGLQISEHLIEQSRLYH